MTKNQEHTNNLVLYLAQKAREEGLNIGPIRLMKMVYLIDLVYAERYGKTYTDFNWIFGKCFGPVAEEVNSIIKEYVVEEDFDGITVRRVKYTGSKISLDENSGIKEIADDIFYLWAEESLDDLLDYVYSTLPMRVVSGRGEKLDLALSFRERDR